MEAGGRQPGLNIVQRTGRRGSDHGLPPPRLHKPDRKGALINPFVLLLNDGRTPFVNEEVAWIYFRMGGLSNQGQSYLGGGFLGFRLRQDTNVHPALI